MRGAIRERDERDARFFAWDVPGDAHIVALVHEAGDAERSATVADAIATSVARRREHTLLLSAEPGPSPLDELLGATSSEGLPAALEGRARLTDVAIQRVDRPFVYLPGGGDATAMRALLQNDVLANFIDRVRERGGTLFIVLSDETLLLEGLGSLLDGYVALGEVSLPDPDGLTQFGRVRFENGERRDEAPAESPAPVEVTPPPVDEPPQAAVTAARDRKPAFRFGRIALAAGGVIGAVALWWWIGDGQAGRTEAGIDPVPASATRAPAVEPSAPTQPPFDAGGALAAFDGAPELAYSVQVASFPVRADAEDRVAELRASGAGFFFIAPTPVRGVVYHRIFASALEGRDEAAALMQALVAAGRKAEATVWDLRPTRLAFDLGVYSSRDEANDRVRQLAGLEIPAYALWAPFDGGDAWRVYGGAYTVDRESGPMAEMLAAAGEPVELAARRGNLPRQPSND